MEDTTAPSASLGQEQASLPPQRPSNTPTLPKKWLYGLGALVMLVFGAVAALAYQNYQLSQQLAQEPSIVLEPSPTPDETANWETYTSPEVVEYFSPFQFKYPSSWTLTEKIIQQEPVSLTVELNSKNGIIQILQGVTGGGRCVYYNDPDYSTYQDAGSFFTTYTQVKQLVPWRLSKARDPHGPSHVICEQPESGNYISTTRIGDINIGLTNGNEQEILKILETIQFKPTTKTNTLFD